MSYCPYCGEPFDGEHACIEQRQKKVFYRAGAKQVDVAIEPKHVWLVPEEPELPMVLIHGTNAYHEDEMHDWQWNDGWLRYYGRGHGEDVWLVLEYENE